MKPEKRQRTLTIRFSDTTAELTSEEFHKAMTEIYSRIGGQMGMEKKLSGSVSYGGVRLEWQLD